SFTAKGAKTAKIFRCVPTSSHGSSSQKPWRSWRPWRLKTSSAVKPPCRSAAVGAKSRAKFGEALERREIGEDGERPDDQREAVEDEPQPEQRNPLLAPEQSIAHRKPHHFRAGTHVTDRDAPEQRRVGDDGLDVFTASTEVPRTGGENECYACTVEHGIEDGPVGAGES